MALLEGLDWMRSRVGRDVLVVLACVSICSRVGCSVLVAVRVPAIG